jgi:energy-coupling factor transporter ATP-binding protein EcfA2
MSLYVRWTNLIKEQADETWLTDQQRTVYQKLLDNWQTQPFVNLHGPPGAGKTFLARLLARYHHYAYVQDLSQAPQGAAHVVLDDANYTRLLRPLARERQLGRVILITRQPIQEAMPKIGLILQERDVQQFCVNLHDRCGIVLIQTVAEGKDLADILRKELVARGELHANS